MKKIYDKLTSKPYVLKTLVGIMLCLIAIIGALDRGIISNFITWVISLLFGRFFYVFYLILFLVGLKYIFSKKNFKISFGMVVGGVILLILGTMILTTNALNFDRETGEYLSFANFFEKFSDSIQGFPKVQYGKISGGFFGFILVSLINSGMTNVGSIIFGTVFVTSGLVLALFKPVVKLIKKIKERKIENLESVDYSFHEARDTSQYDSEDVRSRPTTVLTGNDDLPENQRQTTVIRNPYNGGVGVAYDSRSISTNSFKRAMFDPKEKERTAELEIHQAERDYRDDYDRTATRQERQTYTVEVDRDEVIGNIRTARYDTNSINIERPSTQDVKLAQEHIDLNSIEGNNTQVKVSNVNPNKFNRYSYPPIDLLFDRPSNADDPENKAICEARMKVINETFNDFKVGAQIVSYTIGPAVTRYDVLMNRDQSAKTVNNIVDDISTRLNGTSTRFVQIVPGKNTSGLEIPNKKAATVNFKDCVKYLIDQKMNTYSICFGKDISGDYICADMREFPHLLVCGTTGSGKSVFIHSIIATLIMRNKPSDVRFILIDPKHVEFNKYKNLPFLVCPVINDAEEATLVMSQLCDVMEERYNLLSEYEVDNIDQYNKFAKDHGKEQLPYIMVFIDEYADLVDTNKQIVQYITRLVAKARASGINLCIATQRPSTNVISGVIKANISTRVALLCASNTDSQVIIDKGGAEKLLGKGDMLIKSPLVSKTENVRVQGSFMGIDELKRVIGFLRERYPVEFDDRFCDLVKKTQMKNVQMKEMSFDELKADSDEEKYKQIREFIMTQDRCSISKIQRMFNVGFNRAGKIFDRLAEEGVIEDHDEVVGSNKGRKVILKSIVPEERSGSVEQTEFNPYKRG